MIVREVRKLLENMDDDTLIAVRSGRLGDAYLLGAVQHHAPDGERKQPVLVFEMAELVSV